MNKIYYKFYIDFNEIDEMQKNEFWNYIFSITDVFSLRFPKNYKSEEEYDDYLNRNADLISNCHKNLLKVYKSNNYFGNTYGGNSSNIYVCKLTGYMRNYIMKNNNIYLWEEPNYPEDLCLIKGSRLVFYSCSHEFESHLYLDETQINNMPSKIKQYITNSVRFKFRESELPKML